MISYFGIALSLAVAQPKFVIYKVIFSDVHGVANAPIVRTIEGHKAEIWSTCQNQGGICDLTLTPRENKDGTLTTSVKLLFNKKPLMSATVRTKSGEKEVLTFKPETTKARAVSTLSTGAPTTKVRSDEQRIEIVATIVKN